MFLPVRFLKYPDTISFNIQVTTFGVNSVVGSLSFRYTAGERVDCAAAVTVVIAVVHPSSPFLQFTFLKMLKNSHRGQWFYQSYNYNTVNFPLLIYWKSRLVTPRSPLWLVRKYLSWLQVSWELWTHINSCRRRLKSSQVQRSTGSDQGW